MTLQHGDVGGATGVLERSPNNKDGPVSICLVERGVSSYFILSSKPGGKEPLVV